VTARVIRRRGGELIVQRRVFDGLTRQASEWYTAETQSLDAVKRGAHGEPRISPQATRQSNWATRSRAAGARAAISRDPFAPSQCGYDRP
jgi:hypothetical protein